MHYMYGLTYNFLVRDYTLEERKIFSNQITFDYFYGAWVFSGPFFFHIKTYNKQHLRIAKLLSCTPHNKEIIMVLKINAMYNILRYDFL
jgi:hypothetical protein